MQVREHSKMGYLSRSVIESSSLFPNIFLKLLPFVSIKVFIVFRSKLKTLAGLHRQAGRREPWSRGGMLTIVLPR